MNKLFHLRFTQDAPAPEMNFEHYEHKKFSKRRRSSNSSTATSEDARHSSSSSPAKIENAVEVYDDADDCKILCKRYKKSWIDDVDVGECAGGDAVWKCEQLAAQLERSKAKRLSLPHCKTSVERVDESIEEEETFVGEENTWEHLLYVIRSTTRRVSTMK